MTSKTLALAALATASLLLDARADIITGLVGYWNLSDGPGSSTAADATTNANTAALTGFSDATFTSMWTTNSDPTNGWPFALIFNTNGATGNYVSIPDIAPLDIGSNTKDFTIAAWVNASAAANTEGAIVCKGTGGGGESYCLDVASSKFRVFTRNASGGTAVDCSANMGPAIGTWYHVVGTYTIDSRLVIYINGVSNNTTVSTFTGMFNASHVVSIGNRQSSTGPYNLPWFGLIDDVRIYNRALTPSDVLQLYNNKAFAVVNNGIGSWNGLGGSGGNATLDTTSFNFCTNRYTAPVGTPDNLADLLNVEQSDALPPGCVFADAYYSSGKAVAVACTNLAIASGGVALGTASAAGTMTFLNTAVIYTLASSDAMGLKDGANPTSLVQAGTGTVILTGTNAFSGGTTISSGTVQLGNGGAVSGHELGSAATVMDNGTLAFDGSNSLSFNTTISGTGSVTQKGSGTLTLSTANTYSGGSTIASGAVQAVSIGDTGTSALGTGAVNLSGGTLLYTGPGETTTRQFTGTTGTTNSIDVPNGVNLELSGRVTGAAAWVINKVDTGTLTLSGTGDNSFLGMNVNAGMVILNKTGGTGHAIGNPLNVASGATVQLNGSGYSAEIYNNAAAPVTISSGGVFDTFGQSDVFNSLILSGTGIGGSGALINSAPSTTATLTVAITLSANTTIAGVGSITLPGVVGGSGTLTYSGSGVLTLAGANTYSGGTVVNSGTLDGNNLNSIPGNVTVNGTGILELDNNIAMSSVATLILPGSPSAGSVNLNFAGTQTIGVLVLGSTAQPAGTYGAVGSGATFTSAIFNTSGGGILSVTGQAYWDPGALVASPGSGGTGTWDTSTTNWFTGSADTAWPADALADFAGMAGTVTLAASVNADALIFATAGYVITNTDGVSVLILDGNNPTITVPTGNTTIACTIAESGGNALTVNGPGALTLSGTNTYAGGTTINGATLSANTIADANCSIGPVGALTIQGGGGLSYTGTGAAITTRAITANGAATSFLNVPAGSLELDGQVKSGVGSTGQIYTKTGAGTLILGGSVDNASLTLAINQGEVIITKASTNTVHGLGGGTSTVGTGTVGNSAELQLSGSGNFDLYSGCILTVNGPDGFFDLNGQSDSMSTLTLSGAGPGGSGALINGATNTTSFLTNGGSGIVLAGNTTIGGSGNISLVSKISGGYALTYAGSATLALSGANTYSGGTTINSGGTVQLTSATGGGTGTIAINGNGILTVNAANTYANAITGGSTSVINVNEPSGNTRLTGSLSGFAGTINCLSAGGGSGQLVIDNANNAANPISSSATWNIANGATLDLATPFVNDAASVVVNGVGNNQTFGSLRLDACNQQGNVLLNGTNVLIGDGNTNAPSMISGVISDNGNGYGFTKVGANVTIVLTATNTYSGATVISNGTLTIGGAGCLGVTATSTNYATNIINSAIFNYASSAAQTLSGVISGPGVLAQSGPGVLTLTGSNTYAGPTVITNGSTLLIAGGGCLGVTATMTNYAGNITNSGTFAYASSAAQTLSGVISGTGALTQSGAGTLTLSGLDTYTGATLITNGSTLALAGGGSINNSASISIAAGATFDVSAYSSYTLGSSTTLNASGIGTSAGTAATFKGSPGGTVSLGTRPIALTFKPQTFTGDATHPALYVPQGALTLGGNAITVNNAGASPLGIGTYSLIQVPSGTISASATVTVTGNGLAPGTAATISTSSGSVDLVVAAASVPVPVINKVMISGASLIFSGTNGSDSGTYHVLSSTNVTLPLSQWTSIATNSFGPTGTFSVTNTVGVNPRLFFTIVIP